MKTKFALGQVMITDNAATALGEAAQDAGEFLSRHEQGDWGDISVYEKKEYEHGLADGSRAIFLSAHPLKTGQTIWVLTNLQQGKTTVMLPHERVP